MCECVEVSVSQPVLVAVVEYSKRCRQIICDAGSLLQQSILHVNWTFVFSGAGWNVGSGRADGVSTWQCDLPVAAAATKVSRRETLNNRQCEFQSLWQFRRRAKLKPAGGWPHTVAPL